MRIKTPVNAEQSLINIMFSHTVLLEYQLLDLRALVRQFVERMTQAVTDLDTKLNQSQNEGQKELIEALRPNLFTLIECLSFEDIQGQRLDHMIETFKLLNSGVIAQIEDGIQNKSQEDIEKFGNDLKSRIRTLYTMPAEREIFDQVFTPEKANKI